MKRKITELEQRLIDNGYYLSHKQYGGRKSEKTISYTYVQQNKFVRLDYKRENVLAFGLLNYHAMELTEMEWRGIKILLDMIKNDFDPQTNWVKVKLTKDNPKIIPLSEFDEQHELPPMSQEQFSDMCKEIENDQEKND